MPAALVRDIMTSDVVTVREDATLAEAARLMLDRRVSCLPVVDERGRAVGILTHTNFSPRERHLPFTQQVLLVIQGRPTSWQELDEAYRSLGTTRVGDVMTSPVVTIGPDAPATEAARVMMRHRIRRVPVVEGERIVGIVTSHDLLKLVQ